MVIVGATTMHIEDGPDVDDYSEKRTKILKEINDYRLKLFEKATTYLNVVVIGGYATAFTIWSFTRYQLSNTVTLWVALLLLVSIAAFVSFELFKMLRYQRLFGAITPLLDDGADDAAFKQAHVAYLAAERAVARGVVPIWRLSLVATVVPAAIAGVLLVGNFVWLIWRNTCSP